MKHPILRRVTTLFVAILLMISTALADSPVLRKDAVDKLLDGVGRATISGMPQVLRTFDDAEALPEALMADYSRAVNYAIVRRMDSNTLAPDAVLTRAELLAMVGWAAEPKLEDKGSPEAIFTDLPDWSVAPISRLAAAGWLDLYMTGDLARADGTLGADESATDVELDYFTAKLTELYNTVTPGESFYGYVNDQWMRNRELPEVDLDLPHGVVRTLEQKWIAAFDGRDNIEVQKDAVIAGIMDGSIHYEQGSAAQRFHDVIEICMQNDMVGTFKLLAEYGEEQMQRIRSAESMDELKHLFIDIYREDGTPTLIELQVETQIGGSGSYFLSYRLPDVVPLLSAWIDYFDMDSARPGMVQYLRKVGRIYGVSLTTEEAEALYTLCARAYDGMANRLYGHYNLAHMQEVTDGVTPDDLRPSLEAHPEIDAETLNYKEGCAPARMMPVAEMFAACPSLPLEELLQATGFGAVESVYVFDPAQLSAMDAFFSNEDNLNAAKVLAMATFCEKFPCRTADEEYNNIDQSSTAYLNEAKNFALTSDADFCQMDADADMPADINESAADNTMAEMSESAPADLESAIAVSEIILPEIISELYAEQCVGQAAISDVERMVDMIIDGYIARFQRNTWMAESTRAAALDKLYKMQAYVGFPKGKLMTEITPLSEGGTFISNFLARRRNDLRRMNAVCLDPDYRPLYDTANSMLIEAQYDWHTNSFYIKAGMIQKPFYDPDRSFAGNLGAIGSVIAHEIGHAFDSTGALYDANGDTNTWWTGDDAAAFEALKQEFIGYYGRFATTDNEFQNGERTLGENMADFAGMCVIMDLLEGDPEAQRDALVGFAGNQAALSGWALKSERYNNMPDEHSAFNVRIDAVVASLDAFYELYGITEDDPMYIAPEERLKLW